MVNPQADNSIQADKITVILKAIRRANEPLTIKEIQKGLPGPFHMDASRLSVVLDEQVREGTIYEWLPRRSQKRYWKHDLETFAREKVLEILSNHALTLSELQDTLKRRLFGCSKTRAVELRKEILRGLLHERRVLKHPLMPRKRAPRFGVNPPDPTPYLGRIKKEFENVCDKLKNLGISPEQIFQSVNKVLSPSPEKQGIALREQIRDHETLPPGDVYNLILKTIIEIEPAARQQALVSIRELRASMGLPKETFDKAVLDLAAQGKIFLHRHVYPGEMTDAERALMVRDRHDNYFMGIVLRG